jgi:outer membrane protein assembly factor BamA
VNDLKYYRNGEEYFASTSFGREALGSDSNFYNLGLEWRKYNTFRAPFLSNLNFQFRTAYNQGKENAFSLGSSSTIRGITRDGLEGDVYALLNVNWLVPVPKYPSLRGVLFTDIGNAWQRNDIDLTDWEYTVGVGARWKLQTFVDVSLRVDVGYDPATGDYKAYGGTNYMF